MASIWVLCLVVAASPAGPSPVVVGNPGFESGLTAPWGTGQYAAGRTTWWNSGDCRSTAGIDVRNRHGGATSLRIVNPSPRAPNVFGTTQQPLALLPGKTYRVSLWASARGLASDGGVSVVVDAPWNIRPVQLSRGSYDWREFSGTFVAPAAEAQLRILSEDAGEVWIDDLQVSAVEEPASASPFAPITAAALARFRELALRDYRAALKPYATHEVIDKFERWNTVLWPETDPVVGWSWFVNVSVLGVAGEDTSRPLVAFYNPWADVFLITQWETATAQVHLVDAEVVMGDVLRSRGRFPKEPVPLWLQVDRVFPPAALAVSTGESLRSFESLLGGRSPRDFRAALGGFESPELRDLNYDGAAAMLLDSLDRIEALRSAEPGDDPAIAQLRAATASALKLAQQGHLEELLRTATETLPATRDFLLSIPAAEFRKLQFAGLVVGKERSFVFLTPAGESAYSLSLMFTGSGEQLRLARIDVIVYAGAVRQWNQFLKANSETKVHP